MNCSVVIATWNRAVLLERGLRSILEASRQPQEVIVVDDGSTDHTAEVVRAAADRFRDVQISYLPLRRAKSGWANPAVPRNRGIRLTNPAHEVLVFSEPEMVWMPDTLAGLMRWFEAPPPALPGDPATPWLPLVPTPARLHVSASHIGYVLSEAAMREADPRVLFGHADTDRRWPEINTRVSAVRRADVLAVRGWDEGFVGWGHDDSDFISRLQMLGVSHVPLRLPVVHLRHDPPPTEGSGHNLARVNQHIQRLIVTPNDEHWGLEVERPRFPEALSPQEWSAIQGAELDSWTTKAWPSQAGKLYRERRYLQQALDDLGLMDYLPGEASQQLWVDIGCGPYSIFELLPAGRVSCLALDPLHVGYESVRPGLVGGQVCYGLGCGEEIMLGDESGQTLVSINGIDHFQLPRESLAEMARVCAAGGRIALHYCINNASQGHPHPAHRIDLDAPTVIAWGRALGLEVAREREVYYGWRHQLAAAIVFVKPGGRRP